MSSFNFHISVGESPNPEARTSKAVSADSMEVVRCKMHAFVDERINHIIHMAELESDCQAKVAMREHFLRNVPSDDRDVTSLSIGQYVGVPPTEPDNLNKDLLDLRGDTTV